jgi:hypothetical protein
MNDLLEKRGKSIKIDALLRSHDGSTVVPLRAAPYGAHPTDVFLTADGAQRTRSPNAVNVDALAVNAGFVASRPIEGPTPLMRMRPRHSRGLRDYHRAELVDERRNQRGGGPQPHHIKSRLRPDQDAR